MRQLSTVACRRALVYLVAVRRAHNASTPSRMPPHLRPPIDAKHLAAFANLPLRQRVTDRLADALFALDESVGMCEMESEAARDASWIAPQLRSLYDAVSSLLNAIGD